MDRIGIIDIGPSSLRLMLTEINNNGYFKIIDELKTSIRLCHDLVMDDSICNNNFTTILSTLKAYKSLCTISGVNKIFAVATESLRDARNKDILLPLIRDELNIDIRVLSCEEEIFYNFLGVKRSMYIENSLLVEVAGTDTHLAWVKSNNIIKSVTLPIGSVNLSYNFDLKDRILPNALNATFEYLSDLLEDIDWLKEAKFESIIGIASIIRNIGKIDRVRKRYPLEIIHNYELTDIDVKEIFNLLKSKDYKQRQKLEGIDSEIADIVVGGTAIFKKISNMVQCSKITISKRGLREGILYEYIKENYSLENDILDYSINGVLDTLNGDKNHAKNVFNMTYYLFNALKPLHHLGDEFYNIIKTSSMLHDCGTSINYHGHHKHSFYIILNSLINGLNHKELLMSAAIAASHRFNTYQTPISPFSAIINQLDLKNIKYIGVLLKIAEGLDRSLVGAVKKLDVSFDEETVTINVYSDIDVDFEIRQALRASEIFKEVYKKDLVINPI
ncbi:MULTISPECIES: Ppx/GppA phosphatase family protein [unclassified Clostridium]|uniref:Ppx/GppA phosphatase family protein n=1 Tax=unclassified Clostridium TaxID=2614128 RepID=UPI00290E071B|nr:Ppx/GppA phosphatase family protein [Clostridium sp.]MDU5107800.1 Ppx/GppA phosphatase family protein [Clostridium sp.]